MTSSGWPGSRICSALRGSMIALTLVIVLGIPLGWPSMLVCIFALLAAGVLLGRRRRRAEPPSSRVLPLMLPSAAVLALTVVVLESVFRKGRLQGLLEFDSWDSWGPKAKALYYFGRLPPALPCRSPWWLVLSGLAGSCSQEALHAIGSADMVTVHLQFWFLGIGFVGALIGLLVTRVEPLVCLSVRTARLRHARHSELGRSTCTAISHWDSRSRPLRSCLRCGSRTGRTGRLQRSPSLGQAPC